MTVKVWKDQKGYALEFEDDKFELTFEAFESLVHELRAFEDEHVGDDESVLKEFALDLEEQE